MRDSISDDQARVYFERAQDYDELIRAEDADGAIARAILARVPIDGAELVDVGAGTGRLTRLLGARAAHVHLVERAAPMLEVAASRLAERGLGEVTTLHEADARALPLADSSVDVAMAGWVFGHFRHWMPEGWRAEVDEALAEMRRVTRTGGHLVILETLGTGHETPREHPALDEYFTHLEGTHGFERTWIRTDYAFADVDTAARVLGGFFGPDLVERIRANGWARVPECTALFHRTAG